jgi:hypothetical protein
LQKGILELANGAALDARKESKVLQELVIANKRDEKKKKRQRKELLKRPQQPTKGNRLERRMARLGRKLEKRPQTRRVRLVQL